MVCSVNGQLHTRPRSLALALFGEMIFSLKLYESGPKAWREVGGPWRIRMTNRFSNRFSFSVLSFYAKQFFCLSWFRSCDVLKGLWSLSFVNDAECHYESTGVGVGVFFTLETGRTYELVKIKNSEPQAWRNWRLANQNVSIFFSFHMIASLSI